MQAKDRNKFTNIIKALDFIQVILANDGLNSTTFMSYMEPNGHKKINFIEASHQLNRNKAIFFLEAHCKFHRNRIVNANRIYRSNV
jgi:hypothetical protein